MGHMGSGRYHCRCGLPMQRCRSSQPPTSPSAGAACSALNVPHPSPHRRCHSQHHQLALQPVQPGLEMLQQPLARLLPACASASRLRFRRRTRALRRNVRPLGRAAAGGSASTSILTWSAAAGAFSCGQPFGGPQVASTASAARRSNTHSEPQRTAADIAVAEQTAALDRATRRHACERAARQRQRAPP